MKEIVISRETEGQRLDKFLKRFLPNAGSGFLYRMLRQKKIVVNGAKSEGSALLNAGDVIRIYFSDETFEKFSRIEEDGGNQVRVSDRFERGIVFEDPDLLIYNKPAGMLTQKAGKDDVSLNDLLCSYLEKKGRVDCSLYRPSAVNRLDRNTSGLVLCAVTLKAARCLTALIREHRLRKEYLCLVKGRFGHEGLFESVSENDGHRMATVFTALETSGMLSYVNAELVTGRTHQIREQLSALGHPIAGDPRYGDRELNRRLRKQYGLTRQYLHSYRLTFPRELEDHPDFAELAGKVFEAKTAEDLPEIKIG